MSVHFTMVDQFAGGAGSAGPRRGLAQVYSTLHCYPDEIHNTTANQL